MAALPEPHRQAYLHALGLTPWVARGVVPHAAPSPVWAWPQPVAPAGAAVEPVTTPVETPSAPAQASPAPDTAPADPGRLAALVAEPRTVAPAVPVDAPAPAADLAATPGLVLTLEALWLGPVWLVLEQDDPQAPALGREAQGLAQGLATLWGGRSQARRRFQFPPERMQLSSEETGQALHAFLRGLNRAQPGPVVLCAGEAVAEALQRPRYQWHPQPELSLLVVSSLEEMLRSPAEHKRLTWQALLAAGVYRRD